MTAQSIFSAMKLEGIENNVIMLDSVSKRYSECGSENRRPYYKE